MIPLDNGGSSNPVFCSPSGFVIFSEMNWVYGMPVAFSSAYPRRMYAMSEYAALSPGFQLRSSCSRRSKNSGNKVRYKTGKPVG